MRRVHISVFIGVVLLMTTVLAAEIFGSREDSQAGGRFISNKKQILVLNSYHHGMEWVNEVEAGIRSVFYNDGLYNLSFDFMDAKRNFSASYMGKTAELFQEKYKDKKFDAVIVSDDTAYEFVLNNQQAFFPKTPIIFLGVNEYRELPTEKRAWVTGVVEANDFKKTIELMLSLHPATRQVVVINDKTDTGVVNHQQLAMLLPEFKERVDFVFWEDVNMPQLLAQIPSLPKDSVILLLTFNQDKDNNIFTYEESVDLIAEAAKVPIYGVWDFYVSRGIVGGRVTSGYSQGEAAALLAKQTLEGKKPSELSIITDSPNRYMFNYQLLKKFGINEMHLPKDSVILHKPKSFYDEYPIVVYAIAGVILFLLMIIAGLYYLMMERRKATDSLKLFATVDHMTGVYNRREGLARLDELIKAKRPSVICFTDVNELKLVNDSFGHDEGDELIRTVARTFVTNLRKKNDLVCRVGGDEFLLIFPDFELAIAEKIWGRIVATFEQYNKTSNKPYKVIVSHGFAEYDGKREITVDELIKEADSAMYQEKYSFREQGQNNTISTPSNHITC